MSAQQTAPTPPPPTPNPGTLPQPHMTEIPHEMLIAEFNYIAQSTNQSSEDRARVSNYYLVTIGAAIAAIFSKELINSNQLSVYWAIGIGFIALGLLGVFTLLSLVRLRAGWLDGVAAMNQIKNYYERVYGEAKLDRAFAWKKLPSATKLDSVAFWTAASVIIVDSAMVGLGASFISITFQTSRAMNESSLLLGAVVFGIAIAFQLVLYYRLLALAGKKALDQVQSNYNWNDPSN